MSFQNTTHREWTFENTNPARIVWSRYKIEWYLSFFISGIPVGVVLLYQYARHLVVLYRPVSILQTAYDSILSIN